jgi:hypothetical protein
MLNFFTFYYKKYKKKNNLIHTSKKSIRVDYFEKNINNNNCIKWIYDNIYN